MQTKTIVERSASLIVEVMRLKGAPVSPETAHTWATAAWETVERDDRVIKSESLWTCLAPLVPEYCLKAIHSQLRDLYDGVSLELCAAADKLEPHVKVDASVSAKGCPFDESLRPVQTGLEVREVDASVPPAGRTDICKAVEVSAAGGGLAARLRAELLIAYSTPEPSLSMHMNYPDTAVFNVRVREWFSFKEQIEKGVTFKTRVYPIQHDKLDLRVHLVVAPARQQEQRRAFALRWDNLLDYSEWRTYNVGVFLMYAKDAEHLCKRINEWIDEKRKEVPEAPEIPRASDSDEAWELHRQKGEEREKFVRDLIRPDFIPDDLFAGLRDVGGGSEWRERVERCVPHGPRRQSLDPRQLSFHPRAMNLVMYYATLTGNPPDRQWFSKVQKRLSFRNSASIASHFPGGRKFVRGSAIDALVLDDLSYGFVGTIICLSAPSLARAVDIILKRPRDTEEQKAVKLWDCMFRPVDEPVPDWPMRSRPKYERTVFCGSNAHDIIYRMWASISSEQKSWSHLVPSFT